MTTLCYAVYMKKTSLRLDTDTSNRLYIFAEREQRRLRPAASLLLKRGLDLELRFVIPGELDRLPIPLNLDDNMQRQITRHMLEHDRTQSDVIRAAINAALSNL